MSPLRAVLAAALLLPAYVHTCDDWPDDDGLADVNEGALELLAVRPQQPVHVHSNRIELDVASLQDGWAQLEQCHADLDPVERAQVVYKPGRVRNIRVTRVQGIESAVVEGHSVQLQNVARPALLCIQAESRVVHLLDGGRFAIRNGPFMRSFLDGYYPMHVRLQVLLPPGKWQLQQTRPPAQPGFEVREEAGRVDIDAWFTGRLETELVFGPAAGPGE